MDDGIKIALPGDVSPEEAKKLAQGSAAKEMDLRRVAAQKEADALEEEIEYVTNTEVMPYKDDAPLCEDFNGTRAVGRPTEHIALIDPQQAVVPMPAWTHGRCIGPECARFKTVGGSPICGKALQDLYAAVNLGVTKDGDVDREFERWAYPPEEDERAE